MAEPDMSGLRPDDNQSGAHSRQNRLLLVAWEYPGAHSRQGAALARRVGQIARGFARRDWRVDVIHRSVAHISRGRPPDEHIALHSLADPVADRTPRRSSIFRRLETGWYAALHGDRSGEWASAAIESLHHFDASPPTLVIGCFTPRGPLAVARAAAARWRVPWIADLQDPALEGTSAQLRPLVSNWMRRTLREAAAVVQVSPEWAASDARRLDREVLVLRHARPQRAVRQAFAAEHPAEEYVLLYSGSVHPEHQAPDQLMEALDRLNRTPGRKTILQVAGGEEAMRCFTAAAPSDLAREAVRPLGWLDSTALETAMSRANCLVLLPSREPGRPVVPSKLLEYLAADRPVLIAGPDAGGLTSLYAEWDHVDVTNSTADAIEDAIRRAQHGDDGRLLRRAVCGRAPLTEDDLAAWYDELARRTIASATRVAASG